MDTERIKDSPLRAAYSAVETFVDTSDAQRLLITLWSAHTHIYRKFVATPRLSFVAEGPGTGKSVSMNVALALSSNPLPLGYASQSSVYSYLEEHPGTTLGLDEIDKVFGIMGRKTSRAILASVVNDGYSSTGTVMVMRSNQAVLMPVFTPITTAGLGHLPEDTRTRAIEVRMTAGKPEVMFVPELHAHMLGSIGDDLKRWMSTTDVRKLIEGSPVTAEELDGSSRFQLIMAPLAAIAEAAGISDVFQSAVREWQTGESDTPVRSTSEILAQAVTAILTDVPMTAAQLIEALPQFKLSPDRFGADHLTGMLREQGLHPVKTNSKYGFRKDDR